MFKVVTLWKFRVHQCAKENREGNCYDICCLTPLSVIWWTLSSAERILIHLQGKNADPTLLCLKLAEADTPMPYLENSLKNDIWHVWPLSFAL